MAFRLLYTLEKCGMVEKVGENLYQSCLRPFKQKLFRFGYAAQGTDYQFSKEVSAGLQRSAAAEGIELISLDNQYNPKIAQRNADLLVREKVDLVIEFQTDENVAPIVAEKYRAANIPLIAIEIPHPGATYYGANNYEAGLIGGRYLGRWVKRRWESEADEIVLLELPRAGICGPALRSASSWGQSMTPAPWARCVHFRKLAGGNVVSSWGRMLRPKEERN